MEQRCLKSRVLSLDERIKTFKSQLPQRCYLKNEKITKSKIYLCRIDFDKKECFFYIIKNQLSPIKSISIDNVNNKQENVEEGKGLLFNVLLMLII